MYFRARAAREGERLQICSQYTLRRIGALVCGSIRYKFVGYIGAGVPRARRWFAWLQISMGHEKDYKREYLTLKRTTRKRYCRTRNRFGKTSSSTRRRA